MANKSANKKWNIRTLVTLAMLTALFIILERFLSINAWNMRIGFAFVALAVAGILYGPLAGAVVGILGDIIGMMLFPTGPYFPGFTLNAALAGAVFGWFLYKKQTIPHVLGAVIVNQFLLSLLLQTLWISITYGSPYRGLLPVRLIQCLILTPIQLVTLLILSKPLQPLLYRLRPTKGEEA